MLSDTERDYSSLVREVRTHSQLNEPITFNDMEEARILLGRQLGNCDLYLLYQSLVIMAPFINKEEKILTIGVVGHMHHLHAGSHDKSCTVGYIYGPHGGDIDF